jgi:ribonuclease Z
MIRNLTKSLSVKGKSVAAEETGFIIPECSISLDAGVYHSMITQVILISHSHLDHTSALPRILANRVCNRTGNDSKVIIMVPPTRNRKNTGKVIRSFINSAFQMNMCSGNMDIDRFVQIMELNVDSHIQITLHNTVYLFRSVQCFHGVPAIGYLVSHIKNKLKPEYQEMKGYELGNLKRQGISVTEEKEEKLFTYICDSSIEVLNQNPHVFEYPTIMIECTYIDPEDIDKARENQHIHWLELEPYVRRYPETKFILFHFSAKHQVEEITAFFQDIDLRNVEYFMG